MSKLEVTRKMESVIRGYEQAKELDPAEVYEWLTGRDDGDTYSAVREGYKILASEWKILIDDPVTKDLYRRKNKKKKYEGSDMYKQTSRANDTGYKADWSHK